MPPLENKKRELLALIGEAVEKFLDEHQGLSYYCFAFDCNAAYAEINLCLNTESDFRATLRAYQEGPYGEDYRTEEGVRALRYNPGDWKYQCFETFYVLEEDEIADLYGDDDEALLKEMTAFNYELLALFTATDTFRRIPKTEDFRVLCIDHDEDVDDALRHTDRHVAL